MSSINSQAAESILAIEGPLLKVPTEHLRRYSKDRQLVLNEVSEALEGMKRLVEGPSTSDVGATIDKLSSRLSKLKRKCRDLGDQEQAEIQRYAARVDHLKRCSELARHGFIPANRPRLDRLLVDHMLRQGFMESANLIIKEKGLEDICDAAVFLSARSVLKALEGRNCTVALKWCADYRSKLRKIGSTLEFRLRIQEFVELARKGQESQSISYVRKYIAPMVQSQPEVYLQGMKAAMAALFLFKKQNLPERYKQFFSEDSWQALISLYFHDMTRLLNLPDNSLLSLHLQAGLSVLKTSLSYDPQCTREDPLHLPTFQELADTLPYSQHGRSKLICSISKDEMNEANPPMALPNGYVFSARALEKLIEGGDGKLVCPKTEKEYSPDDRKRVFIV